MSTFGQKMNNLKFKTKVLIIILCVAIIRLGSVIPLPFINSAYMELLLGDGFGFLNSVTGGSFYQMSIFALSISPYITASIILQLLCVVIPPLEEMRKDGKTGEDKYRKLTIVSSIALALIQSASMAIGLGKNGLIDPYNVWTVIGATAIWTIGAGILVAMGEFISLMNIGNGISLILVANILANIPSDISTIKDVLLSNDTMMVNVLYGLIAVIVFVAIVACCVVLSTTEKKIRITNSKKMIGMADNSFPIPLMTCSVMPVIFASSLTSLVIMLSKFFPAMQNGIMGHIVTACNSSSWFSLSTPWYTLGAVAYLLLTYFFTYFYLDIGFNAREIADNFKKSDTVIPGIRPGKPTADYIKKTSTRIALLGNTLMVGLILIMHAICNITGLGTLNIIGTSIIICVNVVIEENRLIKSMNKEYSYKQRSFIFGTVPKMSAK